MTPYTRYRATVELTTPLGTPLAGDTLFGQLCWALRESQGEAALTDKLIGYTSGRPWLVVSDGFPANHLPRPTIPQKFLVASATQQDRKKEKKKRWLSLNDAAMPLNAVAKSDAEAYGVAPIPGEQFHNTINRQSGTTGQGEFAPYTQPLTFHAANQAIDLWLIADEERITPNELGTLLEIVGATGFGRDASIGLGKFSVTKHLAVADPPGPSSYSAWWTLGPCAPQGQDFEPKKSYWRVLTRFGRHGNVHALGGKPFKNPILLAATGAVFTPSQDVTTRLFIGQGLGTDGLLSNAQPATVHQAYAPVIPILIEEGTL